MTVETLRSGIDLSHVETSVRPQDDLFGHVNGRWLAEYQMPGDRATDGDLGDALSVALWEDKAG